MGHDTGIDDRDYVPGLRDRLEDCSSSDDLDLEPGLESDESNSESDSDVNHNDASRRLIEEVTRELDVFIKFEVVVERATSKKYVRPGQQYINRAHENENNRAPHRDCD